MSTDTTQYTSPASPVPDQVNDNQPPPSDPNKDLKIDNGRELRSNAGFSKSLDKATDKDKAAPTDKKEAPEPRKGGLFDKASPSKKDAKPVDPIAKANADDAAKKEKKPAEPGSRAAALLAEEKDDEPEVDAPKKDDPAKKDADGQPVTDAEIDEEMKTPKSEKSERRFRELHRRWKTAEEKVANTAKAIAEKEAKLADLEKQMKEQAAKMSEAAKVDPDIQKKLDELQMYQRQYELESSDQVKTQFDARITAQEESIYTTLQTAGMKFQGMDEKQSIELIKKAGGFREFARKHPDVVDALLDRLNVADRKDVEGAMMGQTMLEREKKNFINTEKGKAKEYFESQKKAAEAAKANEPTPEKRKEAQQAAIEKLKTDMFEKHTFFKEAEIPADASDAEKKRLSEENAFAKELRETLSSHLTPRNDDDFIDTALSATLAHKFKRENVALKRQLKQIQTDLEKVRNASRTSTKGGALPITSDPNKPQKPAPSFSAAIDRSQDRRGSNS